MTAARKEWSIVAVALGLALLVWFARDVPAAGGRVGYLFTIVPADGTGTACASDSALDGYHCEFDEADQPAGATKVLRPFVTVDGERVLLAGVFDGQEMADWLTVSRQRGTEDRVTVRCSGRSLGLMRQARLRWTPTSPWGSAAGLSSAMVDRCSITK